MSNAISTQSLDHSILDQAEAALAEGIGKTGDLVAAYASVLCEVFNVTNNAGETITPWFNLTGKDKAGIKARRASFVARMVARGFKKADGKPSATVDVYWQRVKEASGYTPKGRVTGGTDVDSKTVAELKTMLNRIFKAEEDGQDPAASAFKGQLMEVFENLGGDIDTLG